MMLISRVVFFGLFLVRLTLLLEFLSAFCQFFHRVSLRCLLNPSGREGNTPLRLESGDRETRQNTRHWHVVSKWLDSRASFPIATRLHGKPRVSTQLCGVSFSFHKRILERHAIRIVLGEPGVGSVLGGEHPEVMLVADLLASVDVDPDRDCLLR